MYFLLWVNDGKCRLEALYDAGGDGWIAIRNMQGHEHNSSWRTKADPHANGWWPASRHATQWAIHRIRWGNDLGMVAGGVFRPGYQIASSGNDFMHMHADCPFGRVITTNEESEVGCYALSTKTRREKEECAKFVAMWFSIDEFYVTDNGPYTNSAHIIVVFYPSKIRDALGFSMVENGCILYRAGWCTGPILTCDTPTDPAFQHMIRQIGAIAAQNDWGQAAIGDIVGERRDISRNQLSSRHLGATYPGVDSRSQPPAPHQKQQRTRRPYVSCPPPATATRPLSLTTLGPYIFGALDHDVVRRHDVGSISQPVGHEQHTHRFIVGGSWPPSRHRILVHTT